MELSVGDVVEVYFANKYMISGRVFGEILGLKNDRLRLSVWDASPSIIEYDEINLERSNIVDIAINLEIEVEANECSNLH